MLFTLLLGVFLSLSALAVDLANLYTWRLRTERAAKAAAFAAIQYRSIKGWGYFFDYTVSNGNPSFTWKTGKAGELYNVANDVARANLSAHPGFVSAGNQLVGGLSNSGWNSYDARNDSVTATVTYSPPSFFAGRVLSLIGGSAQSTVTINRRDQASLDPAAIALVLDVSGSMNCSVSGCSCRISNSCGSPTIDQLVEALSGATTGTGGFRSFFNPFKDAIAIIPFNLAAKVSFPMVVGGSVRAFGADNNTFNEFKNATTKYDASSNPSGLRPMGNTNICDGLLETINELNKVDTAEAGRTSRRRKFVVLFSDGAPNAYRGAFSSGTAAAGGASVTRPNNASAGGSTTATVPNDWYNYSIEWRTATGQLYRGPGPLVRPAAQSNLTTHLITTQPPPNSPRGVTTGIAPNGAAICGPITSTQAQFPKVLNGGALPAASPPGCLQGTNMSLTLPFTNPAVTIENVPLDSLGTDYNKYNYARLPFYCAVEAAKYIRSKFQAPIFVVAVGPNPVTSNCTDPFQNVDDPLHRKDNFLLSLAADDEVFDSTGALLAKHNFSQAMLSPSRYQQCNCTATAPPPYPTPFESPQCDMAVLNSAGYRTGQANTTALELRGEYFAASQASQLPALFVQAAKKLLLRLAT